VPPPTDRQEQLPDDADPHEVIANDSTIKANAGSACQVMPMLRAATRETR
jgi:uncharacterized protein